jgi:hypothetical protein
VDHFGNASQPAPAAPDPAIRRREAILEGIEAAEVTLAGHRETLVIAGAELAELEQELAGQLARRDAGLVVMFDESDAHARFQVRKAIALKVYKIESAEEEIANITTQIEEQKQALATREKKQ